MLVPRNDAPLVLPYKKADKRKALDAAGCGDAKDSALRAFRSRVFANSSTGTRASNLKTWIEFHTAWFGHDVPVFPLTVESIEAVSTMMVAGEYRSVENFVSRAKDRHLELGHQWDLVLGRAASCANKSGRRGRGPAHQCAELPVLEAYTETSSQEWHNMVYEDKLLGENVPAKFNNYLVVSSFFLLREIEGSLLLAKSVTFDHHKELVTLMLAASKTDPTALSCSRTWGCTCGGDASKACPYHCAKHQRAWVVEKFSDHSGNLPVELPFFPTMSGLGVAKADVVKCVEAAATALKLPIRLADGKNAYGAHTFRLSGARMMARRRIDIRIIMLLARWESEIVMRYVRDTPLEGLTQVFLGVEPPASSSDGPVVHGGNNDVVLEQLNELADKHEAEVAKLKAALDRLVGKYSEIESTAVPRFVVSKGGLGFVHRAAPGFQFEPPALWRTWCAWSYSNCSYVRMATVDHLPMERKCTRCFRGEID